MQQDMSGEEKHPIDTRENGEVVAQPANIDPHMSHSDTPTGAASAPCGHRDATEPASIADPVVFDIPTHREEATVGASSDVDTNAANDTGCTDAAHPSEDRSLAIDSVGTPSVSATPRPSIDTPIEPRCPAHDDRKRDRIGSCDDLFQLPTLHHFTSSFGVQQVLEQLVEKSLQENRRLDHVLLHGGTGSGTTLVARALLRDLAPNNCVELDVLDGVDGSILRSAIREVRDGGVLLIRHIELLDPAGERMLMDSIGRRTSLGTGRFAPTEVAMRPRRTPKRRPMDAHDDLETFGRKHPKLPNPIAANFTLVATAHLTQPIGYQLRCRFDHMIHLRKDPVGTRLAICRALAREGVRIDNDAYPLVDRYVETVGDAAEQLTQAILARAEIEGIRHRTPGAPQRKDMSAQTGIVRDDIDRANPVECHDAARARSCTVSRDMMRSIIVRDMPCRLPDEVYAHALSLHLAGRRVQRLTDAEVTRIDEETGWGETVVRAALVLLLRAQQMRSTRPAA